MAVKELKGFNVKDQQGLDDLMCKLDGTPNKAKLGVIPGSCDQPRADSGR